MGEARAPGVSEAHDPYEAEGLAFTACKRVFQPLSGGHQH